VKHFRQFGALLLLLVSCVAPTMACLAPDAQMTTEERACCRMMKNQCGQMGMSASHGCCKKAPSVSDSALKTDTVTMHPVAFAVLWVSLFDLLAPHDAITGWVERPEYSPPKSPPSAITILRI
jgi:hypothetical protein